MASKKYELVSDDTIIVNGTTLYRIKALRSFNNKQKDISKNDLGGYIESEKNLGHDGNCWIHNDSMVYQQARVSENVTVSGRCEIYGSAWIHQNAYIANDSKIYGNADISGDAFIYGDSDIGGRVSLDWGEYNDTVMTPQIYKFLGDILKFCLKYAEENKLDYRRDMSMSYYGGTALINVIGSGRTKVCKFIIKAQGGSITDNQTKAQYGTLDTIHTWDWSTEPPTPKPSRKSMPASKEVEQQIDKELDDLWGRRDYKTN